MRRERLPETSVVTKDCLSKDFVFSQESRDILKKIGEIIRRSKTEGNAFYVNNVVGIIGGRGSGKTSLIGSVLKTINENKKSIDIPEIKEGNFICLSELIDPKSLPNYIGIIDLVLASLFSYFKEKIGFIKESERDELFERFESLNKTVSILSQKERIDVIENPSDLYDIASLIDLRKKMEDFVQVLLDADESIKNTAFLMAIDDFDLDFGNCLKMVFEISTFLNIKGIVFLLAMDDKIFDYEIEQFRIKELSDFGVATSSIVENASQFRNIRMKSADKDSILKFGIDEIVSQAREYRSQLSTKFIPSDLRVTMQEHSLESQEINHQINALMDWLFGFSLEDLPKNCIVEKTVCEFCDLFKDSLLITSNLRSRNQLLNQILDLLEKKGNAKLPFIDTRYLRSLTDALKNYPASTTTSRKANKPFLKTIALEIDKYLIDGIDSIELSTGNKGDIIIDSISNGEHSINLLSAFSSFFTEHPCAHYAYQAIVSKLNNSFEQETEFADAFFSLLSFYNSKEENPIYLEKKEGMYVFGEVSLSGAALKQNLFSLNYRVIAEKIRNILKSLRYGKKVVKRDILNLLSDLRDFSTSNEMIPYGTVNDLNELRKRISGIVPWAEESEGKSDVLEELRSQLIRIEKYLR